MLKARRRQPRSHAKLSMLAEKAGQKVVLSQLCSQIENAKKNNSRIPYGFVASLVKDSRPQFPWINRDTVMNAYRRHYSQESLVPVPLPLPPADEVPKLCSKGGRPKG